MRQEIYFDHASTSYPKPPQMTQATLDYLNNIGVSPGRSTYKKAIQAEETMQQARLLIADLICAEFPHQIAFTLNATHALNIIIQGIVQSGDHVITTSLEHNSVLRPLENLKNKKIIEYDIVQANALGNFNLEDFNKRIKLNTKLIILNHGSNVLGSLSSIEKIGKLAHDHKIFFAVDASQTVGLVPIDVMKCNINFLAFTAHKSLLGPSGVGGIYIQNSEDLQTLYQGGTGLNSMSLIHPETMPIKFEAGTINYLGIAGLVGSLNYLNNVGMQSFYKDKMSITHYCLSKLLEIPEIIIYGNKISKDLPIISFNINSIVPQEVTYLLDTHYSIMSRSGLLCAPLIHKVLDTLPHGMVRLSFGYKNDVHQVDKFINALKNIIKYQR